MVVDVVAFCASGDMQSDDVAMSDNNLFFISVCKSTKKILYDNVITAKSVKKILFRGSYLREQ